MEWLALLDIRTIEDLENWDTMTICKELRGLNVPVTLNFAYAIEACKLGVHWQSLPSPIRSRLKRLWQDLAH